MGDRYDWCRWDDAADQEVLHTFFVEWRFIFENEEGEWEQGDSELIKAYGEDEAKEIFMKDFLGRDGIPEEAEIVGCKDHGAW